MSKPLDLNDAPRGYEPVAAEMGENGDEPGCDGCAFHNRTGCHAPDADGYNPDAHCNNDKRADGHFVIFVKPERRPPDGQERTAD